LKAVRFTGVGHPLSVHDVEKPSAAGAGDVIVRIAGAGVCRTDLHILEDVAPLKPPPVPPFTLGHENAGWVDEVGPNVGDFSKGDPVILHPAVTCGLCSACRAGEDMYCRLLRFPGVDGSDGGYAEFLRTSIRALVPLPKGTVPAKLAPMADAGITAYHAVKRVIPLVRPGSIAVVLGIGGLGHLGLQLLKAMSCARIFAVDMLPDRLDLALRLGAERAFSAGERDFSEGILRATEGKGADIVLDFVGEQNTPEIAMKMLARGGTYSIVGYGGAIAVPTVTMITREINMLGNFVGTYRDLWELMELQREGRVSLVTQTYALDQAGKAIDDLRQGRVLGRAVLMP